MYRKDLQAVPPEVRAIVVDFEDTAGPPGCRPGSAVDVFAHGAFGGGPGRFFAEGVSAMGPLVGLVGHTCTSAVGRGSRGQVEDPRVEQGVQGRQWQPPRLRPEPPGPRGRSHGAVWQKMDSAQETFSAPMGSKESGDSYYAGARLGISCMGGVLMMPDGQPVHVVRNKKVVPVRKAADDYDRVAERLRNAAVHTNDSLPQGCKAPGVEGKNQDLLVNLSI